jgi:hypothetical protein
VIPFSQTAKQSGDAGGNLRFCLFPVRQTCEIGGIDYRGLRHLLTHGSKHAQTAKAGIEQQDRGRGIRGHATRFDRNAGLSQASEL